jgi:hypothetical protein
VGEADPILLVYEGVEVPGTAVTGVDINVAERGLIK